GTSSADGANGAGEDAGAAVLQVVAVDRRDDRVLEPELGHRIRHAKGFSEVKLNRPARRHRAEATGARAHVAEDHERRGAPVPAIEDVGAARLFADGVEAASLDDLL